MNSQPQGRTHIGQVWNVGTFIEKKGESMGVVDSSEGTLALSWENSLKVYLTNHIFYRTLTNQKQVFMGTSNNYAPRNFYK